ncbi:MAG: SCO family protein [Betaproteobacteria bacterium]|nr:SCO family protein [Betaproteobacteria bacterium]
MGRWIRVVALAALTLIGACAREPFSGTDIGGADYGRDFQLADHNGKARSLADFRGKAVVLFFGYTRCPDVCPTTMAEAALAVKSLGQDGERVQVLFVTLDPERDTPQLLARYVPAFHPGFLGLYGDRAATENVARDFKVFYQRQPGKTADAYALDHSAGTFVFDPSGKLRLYFGYGKGGDRLAHDLKLLLSESS